MPSAKKLKEKEMQLIQIGQKPEVQQTTILEMFTKLAQKEADFIKQAKERALTGKATVTNG